MTDYTPPVIVPYLGRNVEIGPAGPDRADPETAVWIILECHECGNAVINAARHAETYHPAPPDVDNTLPEEPPIKPDNSLPSDELSTPEG